MTQSRLDLVRSRESLAIAAVLWVVALVALPAAASGASFQGLGVLPGGEYPYSLPWDVSADGSVIAGESLSASGFEAFRWTVATGMVGLGYLGGEEFLSAANGVSSDGQVVVGISRSPLSGERVEAFRWTEEAGMVGLGDLPGGEFASVATGVSSDGSIVTGSSTSNLSPEWGEAFLWTEATGLVGLGVLPGNQIPTSAPSRISADGTTVVGWAATQNGQEAFRWTESQGMVAMGDLPGGNFNSFASDVSADGSVIVGVGLNPGTTSFRWTAAAGMVDLGRPPGASGSKAWGTSADGSVVVGAAALAGDTVPTIWDEVHGMRNLIDVLVDLGLGPDLVGWDLEEATAVSADGLTVVGWAFRPGGGQEAWVAYLGPTVPSVVEVPTASNATLVLFGAFVAAAALAALRSR